MMEGVKPRSSPLVLRRVIVNNVPDYSGKGAPGQGKAGEQDIVHDGCRPYLQLFKSGRQLYSSTWLPESEGGGPDHKPPSEADGTHWYRSEDGAFKVNVDLTLQVCAALR